MTKKHSKATMPIPREIAFLQDPSKSHEANLDLLHRHGLLPLWDPVNKRWLCATQPVGTKDDTK